MTSRIQAFAQTGILIMVLVGLVSVAGAFAQQKLVSFDDYDAYGNLLKATSAEGQVVRYYFGSNSSPMTQNGMLGTNGVYLTGLRLEGSPNLDTQANYNNYGRLTTAIGPNGSQQSFRYDGFGRLDSVLNDYCEMPDSQDIGLYHHGYFGQIIIKRG